MAYRLVRILNVLIAVFLLAAAGAVYWYAWRPLPETSGTIGAPVEKAGWIARNALGVPLVHAETAEDAYFLQGYATAQDRLWQLDAIRRLAGGQLAEVVGTPAIESDREARQWRLNLIAEQWERRLKPEERLALTAYARGINHFIGTHRTRLPLEFQVIGYEPRPWEVKDTLLAGVQMFRTLTNTWREELTKQAMYETGDPAKVEILFPARLRDLQRPGSNAWVVGGKRTATGKPILANDMHLEWSIPDVWHMVQIECPEFRVTGVALPGVPGVIAGHNESYAWGMTNLGFDVEDLYVEQLDPLRGVYVFQGQLEQAQAERSYIRVKDAAPVEVSQWVTRHGPAFLLLNNKFISLKWTAAAVEEGTVMPFTAIGRGRTWDDFRAALKDWVGPSLNFVYADRAGNIGYQVAGKLPIRRGFIGDKLLNGVSGEQEWDGYIPFEELPSAWNPEPGVLVTANDDPFPADFPYAAPGLFDPGYRARRIRDLLESKTGWKAAEQLGVQTDIYSASHKFIAEQAEKAGAAKGVENPGVAMALAQLKTWDGRMDREQAAPLIAELTFQHLRTAIADKAAPGHAAMYTRRSSWAVVEYLLRTRPADWFADWDETVLQAVREAVGEGSRMQGPDPTKWNWGQFNRIQLRNPVEGRIKFIDARFNIGPVPMSGGQTTVQQVTDNLGPSMRLVVDLADWDHSLLNIRTGESAHGLSSHYKDQWDRYYEGKSFPLRFDGFEKDEVLEVKPE